MKEEAPNYLTNLVPKCKTNFRTRNNSIPTFNCWTNCFKYSFFPCTLNDWFNLSIGNSESILIFKSKLLSFIRPVQTNISNTFDTKGLKFLTRLRLRLSHLNEHRFWHNFQDCLNPWCSCSLKIENIHIIFCTAIAFHTIVLFLWIMWNPFVIVLVLCLTMSKKI